MTSTDKTRLNIWNTVEANSWSRDFKYADYERACKAAGVQPLSPVAYGQVCGGLSTQLELDMKEHARKYREDRIKEISCRESQNLSI